MQLINHRWIVSD